MFKKSFFFVLLSITLNCFAQDVSVEKSIFGVQMGLVGVWVYNEARLSKELTLRSEIGSELLGITGGTNKKTTYSIAPNVSIEPRWYYNLEKRNAKGKNIAKNSGNLLSLKVNYTPDLFLITNNENLNIVNQLSFIPKWGIRRVYGSHFTFETGLGLGPIIYFGNGSEKLVDKNTIYIDLSLRIGYAF